MNSPADPPRQPTGKRRFGFALLGIAIVPVPLICLLSANNDGPSPRLSVAAMSSDSDIAQNASRAGMQQAQTGTNSITETVHPASAEATDETSPIRQMALGVWEDDYQGHRTLTLNDDGTGKMVVELSGVAASLFAAKLEFGEEWSFDAEEQLLIMIATGGEPQGKVNLILKMYGKQAMYKVVEVTDKLLVLVDQADDKRYEWRRVEETQP